MKIKYHILLVTILMCTSDVFAWQSDDIKQQAFFKRRRKDSIQSALGSVCTRRWRLYFGETNFGDLVSPSLAIALGYKFTPLFGVRAEVSGWQAKGGWVNPDITYTYKYLQGSVDAMLDLGNLCCGFNPKRFFNAYLFLGAGLNGAFDNDEAVNLNASGYKLQRLWTGKKLYIAGRIGLGTNLRLNDHVAINLEVNTNMLSDKFNSKKGDNADWQFNGLVGLSFTLGKSYRKTTIISNEPEEAVSTLLVVEQPEKLAVVGQLN